jgi:hypothetical protein
MKASPLCAPTLAELPKPRPSIKGRGQDYPAIVRKLVLLHLLTNGIGHIAKNTSYEPHNPNLFLYCADKSHTLIEASR